MNTVWSNKVFAANLTHYMKSAGKNQKEIAAIVGVSEPTVSEWLSGKKYPRIDKIERMANYFGILKSDLIDEHEKPNPLYYRGTLEGVIGRDAELLEMIMKFLALDEQKKKAVKQMIDNLSE